MRTVNELPKSYRWATAEETEHVMAGFEQFGMFRAEYWVLVQQNHGQVDYAVQWDCMIEFGLDHDHDAVECERIMADMKPQYADSHYDDDRYLSGSGELADDESYINYLNGY